MGRPREVEEDARLGPDDPSVVAWGHREDIARANLALGAVVHLYPHPPRDDVAEVRHLAGFGAGRLLEAFGPFPAGLEGPPCPPVPP